MKKKNMALVLFACACLLLSFAAAAANVQNGLAKECLDGGNGNGVASSITSLQLKFYQNSCPQAEDIVFAGVQQAVSGDPRMAASLLRLHFHDCFVLGCDASVLLDDTPNLIGEKTAGPNQNSLRGFDVIDSIKSELELACPKTVSCADILTIAARDSVLLSGGPTWEVEMGRKDSRTASLNGANNNIPGPNSTLAILINKFNNVGLSSKDMVALSGAHTIGKARCATFTGRISGSNNPGETPITNTEFIQSLQQLCTGGSSTLATLDLTTPATFDNNYYSNILSGQGLLPSDQALVTDDADIALLVEAYALDPFAFFDDFTKAMVNMGRLGTAGENSGEVRKNCRFINQ
ncbi:putative peroxidase [Dioscorea sansibarensis]